MITASKPKIRRLAPFDGSKAVRIPRKTPAKAVTAKAIPMASPKTWAWFNPKCGAMSGNPCRDQKGQVRLPVHTVRARAFEKWQTRKNQEAT